MLNAQGVRNARRPTDGTRREKRMKQRFKIRAIDLMVIGAIAGYSGFKGMNRHAPTVDTPTFANHVDLGPLYRTAVQADGRLRSFESHATTYMGYVCGRRSINGQSNGFTYLDMIFRPASYRDADIIYVKKKPVRAQIVAAATDAGAIDAARGARIQKSGLISPSLLENPAVTALLDRLSTDLIRTSKQVDAVHSALTVAQPTFLVNQLRVVAPPDGSRDAPWISIADLTSASGAPPDAVHAGMTGRRRIPGLDAKVQDEVAAAWSALRAGWGAQDAGEVNAQIAKLAAIFPTLSPHLYPAPGRLATESWYYKSKSMTWVWLVYLASVIPLLMSVIYKWDRARRIGMVMFVVAFGFHTASLVVRWYISGRWPNANMFEAVTTSVWFGGVAALVLEWVTRRTPFRNLFALGSAVASMVALMAAYFLPAGLDSSISNKMAALNDVWLYIHTNVIIASSALVALAAVTAVLLLRHRWCAAWDSGTIPKPRLMVIPIALVVLNYAAYRLMMHFVSPVGHALSPPVFLATAGACMGSLVILLLELAGAKDRFAAGARPERSAVGGAAALIMGTARQPSFIKQPVPSSGTVLDGATMVLMELSFILLWTGLVMGAVWADHSWGRPWGWDPKEVFALNTFLIIIALFHVRLKVRDKGFWTAVLAVFGFEVMMFNWIIINFIVVGLHSYA
jgi:ABC-type transport system involved in cytochrome c biogenesis permease subunit